jgi:hypothetical protein
MNTDRYKQVAEEARLAQTETSVETAKAKLRAYMLAANETRDGRRTRKRDSDGIEQSIQSAEKALARLMTPHGKSFLASNASIDLKNLRCSALLVYGTLDYLVPAEKSVKIAKETLAAAHHPDAEVVLLPELSHGLRSMQPGGWFKSLDETETINDRALDQIVEWIKKRTHATPPVKLDTAGPSARPATRPSTRPSTRPATQPSARRGTRQDYYFVLDDATWDRRVEIINAMKFGISYDEVEKALGKPDSDYKGGVKSRPPRVHRRRYITYIFADYRKDGVNTGDEMVDLWFDKDNRLELISSTVSEISPRHTEDAMSDDRVDLFDSIEKWIRKQRRVPEKP